MLKRSSTKFARPSHHANDTATAFKNPWESATAPTWSELLTKRTIPLEWYKDALHSHEKARKLEVVEPDWGKSNRQKRGLENKRCIVGTWLGHAGAIAQLPLQGSTRSKDSKIEGEVEDSLWLLFDPIFSYRAGPTQYTGPARFNKSPCSVADLPACDAVFVSHNHYDHLDASSVQSLIRRFPETKFFVPLGNKSWALEMGVPEQNVYELDWWDKREFSPLDFGRAVKEATADEIILRISCVPAQHTSGRGALDKDATLWCGWVIEQLHCSKDEVSAPTSRRIGSIYHAGDTGYRKLATSDVVCPAFKEIGTKFGAFDLAFIPIWRGGTLGFFSNWGLKLSHKDLPAQNHASPSDAVAIHLDVKARHTIGVHFGTFVGSENECLEAITEFGEACDERGVRDLPGQSMPEDVSELGYAGTINIGASFSVELR
jgi:N-acyl-phosphatidylethanolamine-hydrolysing phospholipase D